ncbi:hypothetical protein, partial [Streptomyces sp. NPDC057909]|uniref:hypothetical protein n=1 Tax=Streptomyces sp. NPDC057909 TaxID=3346277 RepID=UPI0036ED4A1E
TVEHSAQPPCNPEPLGWVILAHIGSKTQIHLAHPYREPTINCGTQARGSGSAVLVAGFPATVTEQGGDLSAQ